MAYCSITVLYIHTYYSIEELNGKCKTGSWLHVYNPTRQDVHGRWVDALLWARMKVFRTSLHVADVERTLHRRRVRFWRKSYVLRTTGRKMTSGKLSYGPKAGRPLNVTSEYDVLRTTLAEWDAEHETHNYGPAQKWLDCVWMFNAKIYVFFIYSNYSNVHKMFYSASTFCFHLIYFFPNIFESRHLSMNLTFSIYGCRLNLINFI